MSSSTLVLDAGGEPPLPSPLQVVQLDGEDGPLAESQVALEDAGLWCAPWEGALVAVVRPSQLRVVAGVVARTGVAAAAGLEVRRENAVRSHRTAVAVLGQAKGPGLKTWRDVLQRGVLGLVEVDVADQFADATLAGLDDGDRHFLRVFLQHHGSRSAVASALSMHRNTVRHRLDAPRRSCAARSMTPSLRADLWFALAAAAPSPRS